MKPIHRRARTKFGMPATLVCIVGVALALPSVAQGQGRRETSHDEGHRHRNEDHVRFTRSPEGRSFENGVTLHRSVPLADHRLDTYFPHHYYSYPHYAPTRAAGVVVSPFGFYVGVFPPYIERSHVLFAPPTRVFIDIPINVNNDHGSGYYLSRRNDDNRWRDDPDLKHAVYDLEDAFRDGDITLLAPLTDPNTKIAVFAQSHYDYSLEAGDYLDMTRDFMRSVQTTGFDAYRVHYKTNGVYQIFAKHTYKNQDGQTQTVYLCIVVERLSGRWTITQIDSSPDRIRS